MMTMETCMNLPLVSHEIPHSLAKEELAGKYNINDFLFVLLHRYIDDKEYRNIVDASKQFKILDNSCFELGEALSNDLIVKYVGKINPDVFVLPDVLGNYEETLERSKKFLFDYSHLEKKAMAVIQGNTHEEFIKCYQDFDAYEIAMMGIPFCFNWASHATPEEHANERVKLLKVLEPYINHNRKHHLLGTWDIKEFAHYKNYKWVYSVDTSNPIAAGIEGDNYPISHKPKIKFDQFVNYPLTDCNIDVIIENVKTFREVVKR